MIYANVYPRLTMIYARVFVSINSYSHVESCILMEDHRELLMTSACLAPTLMSYDVYMSEIILFDLQTLQLPATTLFYIAPSMYTSSKTEGVTKSCQIDIVLYSYI